jgi:hypothetical protein
MNPNRAKKSPGPQDQKISQPGRKGHKGLAMKIRLCDLCGLAVNFVFAFGSCASDSFCSIATKPPVTFCKRFLGVHPPPSQKP